MSTPTTPIMGCCGGLLLHQLSNNLGQLRGNAQNVTVLHF